MGTPEPPVAAAPAPAAPKEHRWVPTITLFVVMLFVSLGGVFFLDTAAQPIAGEGPPPPGAPTVTVVAGVRIAPLAGWQEAQRFSDPEGVRITQGNGTLDAFGLPYAGTAEDLYHQYIEEALEPQASQLRSAGIVEPFTAGGQSAVRGSYVGLFGELGPVEGEVAAMVTPDGTGVIFDGWSRQGLYAHVAEDVRTMVEGVELG